MTLRYNRSTECLTVVQTSGPAITSAGVICCRRPRCENSRNTKSWSIGGKTGNRKSLFSKKVEKDSDFVYCNLSYRFFLLLSDSEDIITGANLQTMERFMN